MKNKNQRRISRQRGFTLIEIMVVVVILAVLGGVVTPMLFGNIKEARQTAAVHDIKTISAQLELYRMKHSKFPTTEEGLEALVKEQYLPKLPVDPWKEPYRYESPGVNGDFDLYSLGPDKIEGGEGVIGNWKLD
jgi:general secretion pathway protein G